MVSTFMGHFICFGKTVYLVTVPRPHPHILQSDLPARFHILLPPVDDECSPLSFSKREYLLAQLRQKDELIDSLLKQV